MSKKNQGLQHRRGAPTSVCYFFHLFVCLSVCVSAAHYISGIVHHLIIILRTHVQNDDLGYHDDFDYLGCYGVKEQKMFQNNKNFCLSPSYLRNHTYGLHLWFTYIKQQHLQGFFLHFFQILIFGVNSGVKGQKMAQHDKNVSVTLHVSGSIQHKIVIFGTHL